MPFDSHVNLGYSTVAVAPSPAISGVTLTLATGEGSRMPSVPFNAAVWPVGVQPLPTNAEIVRVTALSGDAVTAMSRAQESTSARTILIGDQFSAAVTKKMITDMEQAILSNQALAFMGT